MSASAAATLTMQDLQARMSDARQLLQASAALDKDSVRLALLDPAAEQLSSVSLSKDQFLTKDAVVTRVTSAGRNVQVTIVRANGVNTAVTVTDVSSGRALTPLVVQYPIVREGAINEVAYYSSAHPALLSDEVTASGQTYVEEHLRAAAARLAARGIVIPDDIVNIAAHLCVVEHTDHKRFMTEDRFALFPEILSLYALNQANTFRYSVSSAGAGGMIQMIPKTYDGIRQNHAGAALTGDFVAGMRDHENALEAMLLYMNDTWNELASHSEVQAALANRIATKSELMAAGYNSNPMRLPGYLKNGGAGWRSLIPAETQMYLAIYSSVDEKIRFAAAETAAPTSRADGVALVHTAGLLPIFSWFSATVNRTIFPWLR